MSKTADTIVDLHNGTLSGAQIEAGVFSASEITIVSPWFRKSFAQLRGTTSWQDTRLSIGALTLTRGLDLDAINIDLSQIGESRIGLELNVDAFGGKIRARVSSDDHADQRTWDVAGTASEISLAQMSDALDLTDRASGSLHACKFTFRGEATNLREATATVWAEVTGLTWRDRTADTIIDRSLALQPPGADRAAFRQAAQQSIDPDRRIRPAAKTGRLAQSRFPRRYFGLDQRSRRFRASFRGEPIGFCGKDRHCGKRQRPGAKTRGSAYSSRATRSSCFERRSSR